MQLTKSHLRQFSNNAEVDEWLENTSFPDGMTIEMLFVGLLDAYFLAQTTLNLTSEDKLNFVSNVQIKPVGGTDKLSGYEMLRTMQINARISATVSSVFPDIKKAEVTI